MAKCIDCDDELTTDGSGDDGYFCHICGREVCDECYVPSECRLDFVCIDCHKHECSNRGCFDE